MLDAEGVRYEAAALAALARAAQGSLRDSLSLLDQAIAHGGGSVEEESVRAMLGAVGQEHLHAILGALAAGDGKALIAEAERMAAASVSFEGALQELAALLHRVALAQTVPATLAEDDPDRARARRSRRALRAGGSAALLPDRRAGQGDIGYAPDEYAGFTMTLMRMLAFAPGAAARYGPRRRPARRLMRAARRGPLPIQKKTLMMASAGPSCWVSSS